MTSQTMSEVEVRFSKLRKSLDDGGYMESFGLDSLRLVEHLYSDLITTTESLKKTLAEYAHYKQIAEELENGVAPFKEENVRLYKENSQLRLGIARAVEEAEDKVRDPLSRIRDLEAENSDLKLLVSQFAERVKRAEIEALEKANRIIEIQESSLSPNILVSNEKGEKGYKQSMELYYSVSDSCPQCIRIKNYVEYGKQSDKNPKSVNYIKLADSRIEALQLQLRSLKNVKKDNTSLIASLKKRVELRDSEIDKLRNLIKVRPGCDNNIRNGRGDKTYEIELKSSEMKLQILQLRNIELEDKLKHSILQEHESYMRGRIPSRFEEKSLADICLERELDKYPSHDKMNLLEKLYYLEQQLSHCCKEKAILQRKINECRLRDETPAIIYNKRSTKSRPTKDIVTSHKISTNAEVLQVEKHMKKTGKKSQITNSESCPEILKSKSESRGKFSDGISSGFGSTSMTVIEKCSEVLPESVDDSDQYIITGSETDGDFENSRICRKESLNKIAKHQTEKDGKRVINSAKKPHPSAAASAAVTDKHIDEGTGKNANASASSSINASVTKPYQSKKSILKRTTPGEPHGTNETKGFDSFKEVQDYNSVDYSSNEEECTNTNQLFEENIQEHKNRKTHLTRIAGVKEPMNKSTHESQRHKPSAVKLPISSKPVRTQKINPPNAAVKDKNANVFRKDNSKFHHQSFIKNNTSKPYGRESGQAGKNFHTVKVTTASSKRSGKVTPHVITTANVEDFGEALNEKVGIQDSYDELAQEPTGSYDYEEDEYEEVEFPEEDVEGKDYTSVINEEKHYYDSNKSFAHNNGHQIHPKTSQTRALHKSETNLVNREPKAIIRPNTETGKQKENYKHVSLQSSNHPCDKDEEQDRFYTFEKDQPQFNPSIHPNAKAQQRNLRGSQSDTRLNPLSIPTSVPLNSVGSFDQGGNFGSSHQHLQTGKHNIRSFQEEIVATRAPSTHQRQSEVGSFEELSAVQQPSLLSVSEFERDNYEFEKSWSQERDRNRELTNSWDRGNARSDRNSGLFGGGDLLYSSHERQGKNTISDERSITGQQRNLSGGIDKEFRHKEFSRGLGSDSCDAVSTATCHGVVSDQSQLQRGDQDTGRFPKYGKVPPSSIHEETRSFEDSQNTVEMMVRNRIVKERPFVRSISVNTDESIRYGLSWNDRNDDAHENRQLKDKISTQQTKIEELLAENSRYQLKSFELQEELDRTRQILQVEKQERELATSELRRTRDRNSEASARLLLNSSSGTDSFRRGTTPMEMEKEICNLKAALAILDKDKDEMRAELDRKDEKLAKVIQESSLHMDEVSQLKLRLKNAELEISHTGESAQHQVRESNFLKKQVEDTRRDLEKIIRERDDALKELHKISGAHSRSQTDKRSVQFELELKCKEADDLRKQVQRYIVEVRRIEELLLDKEEEMEMLIQHYKSLTVENDKCFSETLNSEIERYRLKSIELQNELDLTKSQLDNEKRDRESAITELRLANEQLHSSSANYLLKSALGSSGLTSESSTEGKTARSD